MEEMLWIKTTDMLPPFGKYVLARHNRGTWFDGADQENVNCVVVKRVAASVEGNNLVPYEWDQFGPDRFFGQEITHWMRIPEVK
jgi:hypothetical protein